MLIGLRSTQCLDSFKNMLTCLLLETIHPRWIARTKKQVVTELQRMRILLEFHSVEK